VFYTVPQSTGFMADYGDLLQMVAIVATVLGVPAFLGEYIIGAEAALANPALSQTIGKVAMNTVLTGGDITGQLSKAVLGTPGAFVGDFVGTGLDSAQIGKVAEAVTTAKLQGGNVATAALLSLTTQGAKSMGDYDVEIPFDFENQIQYGDMSLTDIGVSFDAVALEAAMNYNEQVLTSAGIDPLSFTPDNNGNIFSFAGELLAPTEAAYGTDYYAASDGSVKDVFNRTIINADDAMNMSAAEIEQQLYNDWSRSQGQEVDTQPGDKLRPADKASVGPKGKVPSITDQAYVTDKLLKTAVSIGASIKAISNGTFRVQNPSMYSPYGTARPQAVGVPIQQPDGSIVTNNGNGTQTIRRPNGTVQTVPTSYMPSSFGSSFGGVSQQTLLIGGAVLLGAFLLTRRK
jgi:hypothetical protein